MAAVDSYRPYRVPREFDSYLIEPQRSEIERQLAPPGFSPVASSQEFCGKSFGDARSQARREIVDLAFRYTERYAGSGSPRRRWDEQTPIVLSGHQPELFHAGVWFKNFLLSDLSSQGGALAINFLVDNDDCRTTSVRVPTKTAQGTFKAQSIEFDTPRDAIPWELRTLNSRETWDRFPSEVEKHLVPLDAPPLLGELWPMATEGLERSGRVGAALAEARHRLELQMGFETLEVPLSSMVSTRAFARFTIQLLSQLPRFQATYNSARADYRQAHRIRNAAHPVPALEQEQGWMEAPLWVYRAAAPHRKRLWVRILDDQLILSDRSGWQEVIEGRLDCDQASSQWLDLLAEGICLRPRALLTTMYLRLFVGDLFIHGIGGAKYDQLTDQIIRELMGIEPPPIAVATSTLHLPYANASNLPQPGDLESKINQLRQDHWRLNFEATTDHAPEKPYGEEQLQQLKERQATLLQQMPPKGQRWKWHQEMTAVRKEIQQINSSAQHDLKREIDQLTAMQRQAELLGSREFSFCLYPKGMIRKFLTHQVELSRAD